MQYIIKVNAQTIENKEKGTKFVVFNTYIKSEISDEWLKYNVKFSKVAREKLIERTSYIYVDEKDINVNELGKYPEFYIKDFAKQKVIEIDTKNLSKFFKSVEEDIKEAENIIDEPFKNPVEEKDLPFDNGNSKDKN